MSRRGRHFYQIWPFFVLATLFLLPFAGRAQFNYATNNGEITITRYTGSGGAVTVPSAINGFPVVAIGANAFSPGFALTSVTIPDSVKTIGTSAFISCQFLRSVTLGSNLTTIGATAFAGCTSLTNIMIPDSVTFIGEGAFNYCTKLAAIAAGPANLSYSSLEGVLFSKDLTSLQQCPGGKTGVYVIPSSVTTIKTYAFHGCVLLTNVLIPTTVVSIGSFAFNTCTNLSEIIIPSSILAIGSGAFNNCPNLTAVTVEASNLSYRSVNGVLFNQSQTSLVQCPGGKAGVYAVPHGVTTIGEYAFFACQKLHNVILPDTLAVVASDAFRFCNGLTSLTIPHSVTNIGSFAFNPCTNLSSLYFARNTPGIGSFAFDFDSKATVYYLPNATGWGPAFGGRPTVLWNPQFQTSNVSFGIQPLGFGLPITGTGGIPIVLETTDDLTAMPWSTLLSCTLTNGSIYFTDPDWANHPSRFYRIRSP